MGNVLTASAQLNCAHSFPVALSSSEKLTIGGVGVLTASDVVGASIACTAPTTQTTKTCTKVASASGTASKLTVGNQPVFLDSIAGQSDGLPPTLALIPGPPSKLTAS